MGTDTDPESAEVEQENPWDRSVLSDTAEVSHMLQQDDDGQGSAATYRGRGQSQQHQPDKQRVAGRNVWIQAACVLVSAGARWSPDARYTGEKSTQLHLLFAAFPPAPEDVNRYCSLMRSALDAGLSPSSSEDTHKRNALFVLCSRMATVPSDQCPDALKIMKLVLNNCSAATFNHIGAADRYGKTVFDIVDSIPTPGSGPHAGKSLISCLSATKHMLYDANTSTRRHKPKAGIGILSGAAKESAQSSTNRGSGNAASSFGFSTTTSSASASTGDFQLESDAKQETATKFSRFNRTARY